MRRWGIARFALLLLALVATLGAGFWFLGATVKDHFRGPDPVTVAQASLQGLREQNRLSTFAARYVAVVTSRQSRLGLGAEKTLIMPGMVRYEVDLAKLQQKSLSWDAANNRLTILLPPLEVIGPDVDLDGIREYSQGGLLMRFTDVEAQLDAANRKAGQQELIRQARDPTPVKLARDATRRAIERSFAMPLKAAGIDAKVAVYFPDERPSEDWDRSRGPEDVVANRY
ncbi:hypothetical protein FHS95_001077 [Sphingomonas naasensis]|uniref:DUF4230 domain-containing protein n=1 Tax=Sphingomonas naasensis TaxID=1344951 RepID=A0A4S1WCJ6_9SPHN|nr:DUF4230 domain-containing protein [Sphingomonas naasensis]NIJ19408.1 hypothetical protein [Sphingomonas naasensis]TGX39150.1 DUF4230 domain-containing protein [Sphingomonas naasensis]